MKPLKLILILVMVLGVCCGCGEAKEVLPDKIEITEGVPAVIRAQVSSFEIGYLDGINSFDFNLSWDKWEDYACRDLDEHFHDIVMSAYLVGYQYGAKGISEDCIKEYEKVLLILETGESEIEDYEYFMNMKGTREIDEETNKQIGEKIKYFESKLGGLK